MTEFIHKPYEKIYVRDMIKLNLDDLIGNSSDSVIAKLANNTPSAQYAFAASRDDILAKKRCKTKCFLTK